MADTADMANTADAADTDPRMLAFARTAVEVGVNLQPGQVLHVQAPFEAAAFVRLIAKAAYGTGGRLVDVDLRDERLSRIRYEMAPADALAEYPPWRAETMRQLGEREAAFLNVMASDPDLLRGVDPERVAAAEYAAMSAMERVGHMARIAGMRNVWCVVSVPTPAWAAKVFPDEAEPARTAHLWDCILQAARVDGPDPVAAWKRHLAELEARAARLNALRLAAVHFRGPGTDLTVDLVDGHLWASGPARTPGGVAFVPNMPTEEVFTAPARSGARGVVRSTRPVPVRGVTVRDLELTFADGRVVGATASTGGEALLGLLRTDDGAIRLGELALAPDDSPVAQLGALFYNPLFDENAACHLALGRAYPVCVEGGADLDEDALTARGVNTSLVHLDFMVGSSRVDVDGLSAAGDVTPLMRGGCWAFSV